MTKDYPLLIGREWQTAGEPIEIRSPFNGEVIGTTYLAEPDQISAAIAAADECAREMSDLPAYARAEIFARAAAEVKARGEELPCPMITTPFTPSNGTPPYS